MKKRAKRDIPILPRDHSIVLGFKREINLSTKVIKDESKSNLFRKRKHKKIEV